MKVVKLAGEACSVDDYVAEEFLSNLLCVVCLYVSVCEIEKGHYLYVSLSNRKDNKHLRNSQCHLHQ